MSGLYCASCIGAGVLEIDWCRCRDPHECVHPPYREQCVRCGGDGIERCHDDCGEPAVELGTAFPRCAECLAEAAELAVALAADLAAEVGHG